MNWVLSTVLCIILIEFVLRVPLPAILADISSVGRKALHTLGAKSVSDHWKEKVMLAYASKLFLSTMKLAVYFAAFALLAILIIFAFDYFGASVGDFIVSWTGISFSFVIATIYIMIRKYFV